MEHKFMCYHCKQENKIFLDWYFCTQTCNNEDIVCPHRSYIYTKRFLFDFYKHYVLRNGKTTVEVIDLKALTPQQLASLKNDIHE